MKSNYIIIKKINFLLKKNYVAILYNFKNVKSLIIHNLKKQFYLNICFINPKIILKLVEKKYLFPCNLIICKIENIIKIIKYIETFINVEPLKIITKECIIENFCLTYSKLSINNLIFKLKNTILFNLKKFLKLIKNYEKFINK